MKKAEVIEVLGETAVLLELMGESPFRVRAYQAAARTLETMEGFESRVADGTLREIKGIGPALTEKITTLWETGTLDYFEKLRASVPVGLLEMLEIRGMLNSRL